MKLRLLLVAGLALLMATTGCKKEEETVKHTSKVYSASTITMNGMVLQDLARHVQEEWTWNGDKVATIKHFYTDGRLMHTANYSYTDGRLTGIDDHFEAEDMNEHIDIAYNSDGKISTLTQYTNDTLVRKYTFEYNGSDKFTGYTFIHKFADIDDTTHYTVEWTGENITRLTTQSGTVVTYAYDNNPNPYYGITDVEHLITGHSKNNLTSYNGDSRVYTYDSDGWPIKYEGYTYDGDGWPIKYDGETAEPNYAIKVCIEFEYEK